jgi:hypothetical protein
MANFGSTLFEIALAIHSSMRSPEGVRGALGRLRGDQSRNLAISVSVE